MIDKTIKDFIKAYDLINVPQELPTAEMYANYLTYCAIHRKEPCTKYIFTKQLRRYYGYHRKPVRFGKQIINCYKFTGEVEEPCIHCNGSGYVPKPVNK